MAVAICRMGVAATDGCAMAVTVGVGRACTVNGCVVVLVQRHDVADNAEAGSLRVNADGRLMDAGEPVATFPAAAAADTIDGYGADVVRAWPAIRGFGTFGVQTAAHGNSPTKRSPTGLASGCACEVIFAAMLNQ